MTWTDPKKAIEYRNRPDIKAKKAEANRRRMEKVKSDPKLLKELQIRQAKWARDKRKSNPDKYNKIHRKYTRSRRIKVIKLLGSKCTCCGETIIEFLSVQHKNNDGAKHRRKIGSGATYNWILKNPIKAKEVLEIMCMNCNTSYGFFGYCPHKVPTKLI